MASTVNARSFRGVWRRTELFEPRGELGPEADRKKIVIWVQSSSGVFIDIRVCPSVDDNTNPLNLKSFAGTGEYDSALKHFTWTRVMDFRPPGAPDVGLIHFASEGVIEEDGVLPGDDFKEIWTQQLKDVSSSDGDGDFVCEVKTPCGKRKGYFLIVGDYFAFTLSREADSVLTADKLNSFFDGKSEMTVEETTLLMQYVCVMGRTTDWKVLYSLDNSSLDCCILPGHSPTSELLSSLQWIEVEGVVPEALAPHVKNSSVSALPKPSGPPVPSAGLKYKGLPVPFFFQDESAEKFRALATREDDVFVSSMPKGGTTWVNKLVSLLTTDKYDDEGAVREDYIPFLGGLGHQVYPEGLASERLTDTDKKEHRPTLNPNMCFADLEEQPSPRLFTTHLFGKSLLPQQLVAPDGQGKLIIVLRNLKDTMASLHFFRGEAKDGWLGNAHGPGSFARFIAAECPNAYGSSFDWIIQNDAVYNQLVSSGRVLVLYFEALKKDLPGQLQVLHSFLGLGPLSVQKCEAITREVDFKAMKDAAGADSILNSLLRKGHIGDWKNYMSVEQWNQLDEVFEERLGSVGLAAPLRSFHVYKTEAEE